MSVFSSSLINSIFSDVLRESTDDIADNSEHQQFKISMEFYTPDNPEWSIKPVWIETLSIVQQEEDYSDTILSSLRISPKEHVELTRNFRNLFVRISFTFLSTKDVSLDPNKKDIMKEYRVFIIDKKDLIKYDSYKKFIVTDDDYKNDVRHMPVAEQTSTLLPITVQFIDPLVYVMRHNFINTIMKDMTMNEAIKYIASKLGVRRLSMVPPDNKLKYRNLYVDPINGSYDRVFTFLQEKYGIYKSCMNFNYSNGVLSIYPSMGFNVEKERTLHIVNIEATKYRGLSRVHRFKDVDATLGIYSNMYLLNTETIGTLSFNEIASENSMTNAVLYRDDRSINIVDYTSETPKIPDDNVIILDSGDEGMNSSSDIRLKFFKSTNNLFKLTSNMVQQSYEHMTISVPVMIPFTQETRNPYPISIGRRCKLYYDTDEGVKIRNAIVSEVGYSITRQRVTSKFGYTFECKLILGVKVEISSKDYKTKTIKTIS